MSERLSEQVGEQLTTQIVASIRRMTDEQLSQLIRSQCADEAALRAECERLKARRVPNLDEMGFEELNEVRIAYTGMLCYIEARKGLLWGSKYGDEQKCMEDEYTALPPWAKFREE